MKNIHTHQDSSSIKFCENRLTFQVSAIEVLAQNTVDTIKENTPQTKDKLEKLLETIKVPETGEFISRFKEKVGSMNSIEIKAIETNLKNLETQITTETISQHIQSLRSVIDKQIEAGKNALATAPVTPILTQIGDGVKASIKGAGNFVESATDAVLPEKYTKHMSRNAKIAVGILGTGGAIIVGKWLYEGGKAIVNRIRGSAEAGKEAAKKSGGGKLKALLITAGVGLAVFLGLKGYTWAKENKEDVDKIREQLGDITETAEQVANTAIEGFTKAGKTAWDNVPNRLKNIIFEKGTHTMNVLRGKESYSGNTSADFLMALAADGIGEFVIVGGMGYLLASTWDLYVELPFEAGMAVKDIFFKSPMEGSKELVAVYIQGIAVYATSWAVIDRLRGRPGSLGIMLKESALWPYEIYAKTSLRGAIDRQVGVLLKKSGAKNAGEFREIRGASARFFNPAAKTHRDVLRATKKGATIESATDLLSDWNQWDNLWLKLTDAEINQNLNKYKNRWDYKKAEELIAERRATSFNALEKSLVDLEKQGKLPDWVPDKLAKQLHNQKDFNLKVYLEEIRGAAASPNFHSNIPNANPDTIPISSESEKLPVSNTEKPKTAPKTKKAAGAESMPETKPLPIEDKPKLKIFDPEGRAGGASAMADVIQDAEKVEDILDDIPPAARNMILEATDEAADVNRMVRGAAAMKAMGPIDALFLLYEGYQLLNMWREIGKLKEQGKNLDGFMITSIENKEAILWHYGTSTAIDFAATGISAGLTFTGNLAVIGATGGIALVAFPTVTAISTAIFENLKRYEIQQTADLEDRIMGKDELVLGQSKYDQLYELGDISVSHAIAATDPNVTLEDMDKNYENERREILLSVVMKHIIDLHPKTYEKLVSKLNKDGINRMRYHPICEKVIFPFLAESFVSVAKTKGQVSEKEIERLKKFDIDKDWLRTRLSEQDVNNITFQASQILEDWIENDTDFSNNEGTVKEILSKKREENIDNAQASIDSAFGYASDRVYRIGREGMIALRKRHANMLIKMNYYNYSKADAVIADRNRNHFAVDYEEAFPIILKRFDALNNILLAQYGIPILNIELDSKENPKYDKSDKIAFLKAGDFSMANEINKVTAVANTIRGFGPAAPAKHDISKMKNWVSAIREEYRSLLNEFKNPKTEELLWINKAA